MNIETSEHSKVAHSSDSTPMVSVLVVTYRNPALTRKCLQSLEIEVRDQSVEVLIVDNASNDGTAEMIAAEFPWARLDARTENLGFARGNNLLSERARGTYLLLLNPDTVVHPGMLDGLLALAKAYPTGGAYAGRTLRPSGELDPGNIAAFPTLWSLICFATGASYFFKHSRWLDPESLGPWKRDSVRQVDFAAGCLLMMRRQTWNELGGFDTEFWMYGEDADLLMRVKRAGYSTMFTPKAEVTHVVGVSSSPNQKNVMVMGSKVRLIRKHWSPAKLMVGTFLLQCGCGLRSLLTGRDSPWRYGWQQRRTWSRAGK